MCWFFLHCFRFGLFGYFAKWLASQTVSKWCLCRGVSLHKGQLLQEQLTFEQNSSYVLFWFFHYIFSFFFTVLVVHPQHDHPVTTVLTHYSFYGMIEPFCAESAVKHQPTNLCVCKTTATHIVGESRGISFLKFGRNHTTVSEHWRLLGNCSWVIMNTVDVNYDMETAVNICCLQDSRAEVRTSCRLGLCFKCLQEKRDWSAWSTKGKEDYEGKDGFD